MPSVPFFTIITATRNAAACLPRLLESLAAQTCCDFVWVVQDGSSSDTTLNIIETWRERLPAVSVESAPDEGIYDAWNRALVRQGEQLGQWVLFLGADDVLADASVLERTKLSLAEKPVGVDMAVGDLRLCGNQGPLSILCADISYAFAMRSVRMLLPHPALFASRSLLQGQAFDASIRIAGDYEWLLRVWHSVEQAVRLGFVVTQMGSGGVSDSPATAALLRAENRRIMRRYPPCVLPMWPQYIFVYVESLLHEPKLLLKRGLHASSIGRWCWGLLRAVRKSLFGGRP